MAKALTNFSIKSIMIKKTAFLLALCAQAALQSFGWGQKGHDTVAFIAENHLTPAAKAAVDSIFNGRSIVYYANWLDNASHTPDYAYTKTWHYKNIDADVTFRSAPLHPDGDVVRGIYSQAEVLANPDATPEQRDLALRIIVHLVGDIHQPMHLGHASDLGGNRWNVKHFSNNSNLHREWDSSILEAGHKWSYSEWQQQLDRATPEQYAAIMLKANPENWAEQSYEIAKRIYNETPVNTQVSYDYIAKWTPVIEDQLLAGGLRLADLLNTLLDPDYKGAWSPVKR